MKNYSVKIYIGAELDRDGNRQECSVEELAATVQRTALVFFGGGTIYLGQGYWKGADGRLAVERCVISEHVVLNADNKVVTADAGQLSQTLRRLLNQESVLCTIQELAYAEFVEAA